LEVSGQLQVPAALLPETESLRGGLDDLEKINYNYYLIIIVISSEFCDRRVFHSRLKAIVVNTWHITCSPRLVHLYSFCCNIYDGTCSTRQTDSIYLFSFGMLVAYLPTLSVAQTIYRRCSVRKGKSLPKRPSLLCVSEPPDPRGPPVTYTTVLSDEQKWTGKNLVWRRWTNWGRPHSPYSISEPRLEI